MDVIWRRLLFYVYCSDCVGLWELCGTVGLCVVTVECLVCTRVA